MDEKKKNLLSFTLRGKLILILSLVVISVSAFLLYFSASMIIKDKRAYLFDSAYSNLETIAGAFEQFTESKERLVDAYVQGELSDRSSRVRPLDPDIFQVHRLSLEDLGAYKTGLNQERIFITLKDRKLLDQKASEDYLQHPTQASVIYTNDLFFSRYKKRYSFLLPPIDEIKKRAYEVAEKKIPLSFIHFEERQAPRLIILRFLPAQNEVICFDFFFDFIVERFINKTGFENSLVNSKGEVLFQNRPNTLTTSLKRFFKRFTERESKKSNMKDSSGVREFTIGDNDFILGYKRLVKFPDFYIFSGIKTSDAYEVTTILVVNTVIYALILVGLFNLVSIFLARTITDPIEKFIDVIRKIADGNYQARVERQNTVELQVMATTFNKMVDKIEDYNRKLMEYNRTLEQKVEERTVSLKKANTFIKTMVDSIAQGLLVFDRSGSCLELYTRACENLLGVIPSKKKLSSILKAEDRELLDAWIGSLFDEMIPFESLVELGPKVAHGPSDYRQKDFKHVTLDFFPMRGEGGTIDNVVMLATDKTKEFKAQKQIIEEQNYVKLVTKVIKDKGNFLRFVDLFQESFKISHIKSSLEENQAKNDLMRLLHSMKGSAAFFNMQDIVDHLHDFETEVMKGQLTTLMIEERNQIALSLLEKNLARLKVFLSEDKEKFSEIPVVKIRAFYQELTSFSPALAKSFSRSFLEAPVENYIEQYKALTSELADKLGKEIAPLEVTNGDILVDREYFRPFFDSCIHIFRNAVDHGIEPSAIRQRTGKSRAGQIKINFELFDSPSGGGLLFQVRDDGGGIDPSRIRRKIAELNYPESELNKSDEDVIYHIFDASFSTAEQVTDLSGRGVGLYDVKLIVEKLGGEIQLLSKVNQGTLFSFKIPFPV